jgi:hypothetical protein
MAAVRTRGGSESALFVDRHYHLKESRRNPGGFFARLRLCREGMPEIGVFSGAYAAPQAGKSPQVCWTSSGRFAKRRPLAMAFSGRVPGA